jgi:hypothetical protein
MPIRRGGNMLKFLASAICVILVLVCSVDGFRVLHTRSTKHIFGTINPLKPYEWLVKSGLPIKLTASGSTKKKKSKMRYFRRTNRIDGQEKWIRELYLYKRQLDTKRSDQIEDSVENISEASNTSDGAQAQGKKGQLLSPVLIVELAKELLYSGIPEQVLELYAAYYDIIVREDSIDRFKSGLVAPDPKLILVATRAFIALGDIRGALQLLQATSRSGLEFDAESKSSLMVSAYCWFLYCSLPFQLYGTLAGVAHAALSDVVRFTLAHVKKRQQIYELCMVITMLYASHDLY